MPAKLGQAGRTVAPASLSAVRDRKATSDKGDSCVTRMRGQPSCKAMLPALWIRLDAIPEAKLPTVSLEHVTNNKQITPEIETELPFSVATDNESLECNIRMFDMQQYCVQWNQFSAAVGLVFDGKASHKLADVVEKKIWE